MPQTSEGGDDNLNTGYNQADLSYKNLLAQQDELQNDLKKLAKLINTAKTKSSKTGPIQNCPQHPMNLESAPSDTNSISTEKNGKGCGLGAQSKGCVQSPSNAVSENVSNNDLRHKNCLTAKYIRIQADPDTGEPLISIFDESGQTQAVCAYLTKDFKLDIDCKLWNKNRCSDDSKRISVPRVSSSPSNVGQGQQCPSPSSPCCPPSISVAPCSTFKPECCPPFKPECCPVDCTPPFGNWFIWRIDNYTCVEERNDGDWCNPFYLGQPGYRMQAKLEFTSYLFGVYIRLCVGDYDGCLGWPFDSDIYFSILDQTGAGNHIVRVLRPYLNDCDECGVWERPSCESQRFQTGWGIPDLGLRSLVHAKMCKPSPYLRNGTMYLQITLGKSLSNLGS